MFSFTKKSDVDRIETEVIGDAFGNRRGEPVNASDCLVSQSFADVVSEEEFAEITRALLATIDEADSRGALDAGSARFLDQLIEKKLGGWLAQLTEQHRRRSDQAARLVANRLSNATVSRDYLMAREDQLAKQNAELARLERVLRGPDADQRDDGERDADSSTGALVPLPAATHLSGLGLRPSPQPTDDSIITVPTEWSSSTADLPTEH